MPQADAVLMQHLSDLEGGDHTRDAIEPTAAGHRVDVGTKKQCTEAALTSGTLTEQVGALIESRRQSGSFELAAQPVARLQVQVRERPAVVRPIRFSELRQAGDSGNDALAFHSHYGVDSCRRYPIAF